MSRWWNCLIVAWMLALGTAQVAAHGAGFYRKNSFNCNESGCSITPKAGVGGGGCHHPQASILASKGFQLVSGSTWQKRTPDGRVIVGNT